MKKVTMRDVAKLAGVSIATVSYVLNNNDKESIPDETKKRVMEAINELNYIPDLTARALTRKMSRLIGIFIMDSQQNILPWKSCYYSVLISELIKNLYGIGYHAIVEYLDPTKCKLDIIYERALDGVFLLDINEKYIYNTTNIFKVPIILVDSYIEDTLFHKVLSDYYYAINESKKLLNEQAPIIIADSINSKELIEKLCTSDSKAYTNIYAIETEAELQKCLEDNKDRKAIIFNEFLAVLARKYTESDQIAVICTSGNEYLLNDYKFKLSFNNHEKAALAVSIMMEYINRKYYSDKFSFIRPNVDRDLKQS